MFISDKYQLIFLEVPRTGSNSVTDALTRMDPDAPTAIQRQSKGNVYGYHKFDFSKKKYSEYLVFAGHRNPFDRIWSYWKYRHRTTGHPEIFKSVSWPQYVQWAHDPSSVPEIKGAMLDIPVSEMFDCGRIDYWLCYETLVSSWRELAKLSELPLPALDKMNQSMASEGYRNAFDENLADLVTDRFIADFKRFGYDTNSWKWTDNEVVVSEFESKSPGVSSTAAIQHVSKNQQAFPRVAILTNFLENSQAFSLNRVVQDQIAMLVKHNYKPRVLVKDSCHWNGALDRFGDPDVDLVKLPHVENWSEGSSKKEVDSEVEKLTGALEVALSDIDVVLTHDIIYQPAAHKLLVAIQRAARKHPKIVWLHWVHSAAAPSMLKRDRISQFAEDLLEDQLPRNSYPVFFNRISSDRVAEHFQCEVKDVKYVPHPIDVCRFLGLSEMTTRLYEEMRLYLVDYLTVVPVRLARGKQVEWVVKIMARLKSRGDRVAIVVMDFHSIGAEKEDYRKDLRVIAQEWGLDDQELVFLSEFDESLRKESPHDMVRELFSLSNVYILPSRSESYSLAAQEAALMGNLLVLNDDFPPMRDIFGNDALYFQFSSEIDRINLRDGNTQPRYQDVEFDHPPFGIPETLVNRSGELWIARGEVAFADMIAKRIRYEFENNLVLRQRQKRLRDRNLFAVFSRYLEPLLYLGD